MYIIIVGGGKVGYFLTKELSERGQEILLIEKNPNRFYKISNDFPELVIHGSGTETHILRQAGIGRADTLIAVTGKDEDNLVIAQLAKKKFKVPNIIVRVNNPKNFPIFHALGITNCVSSTSMILSIVEEKLNIGDLIPLLNLKKGNIEIVEIDLKDGAPAVGKQLSELNLPPEKLNIIGIIRDDRIIFPQKETTLLTNDSILFLLDITHKSLLDEVFGLTS